MESIDSVVTIKCYLDIGVCVIELNRIEICSEVVQIEATFINLVEDVLLCSFNLETIVLYMKINFVIYECRMKLMLARTRLYQANSKLWQTNKHSGEHVPCIFQCK